MDVTFSPLRIVALNKTWIQNVYFTKTEQDFTTSCPPIDKYDIATSNISDDQQGAVTSTHVYDMSLSHDVLDSPWTTIGARGLLQIGTCRKYGFVRIQGALERKCTFLRWKQKFMVLSMGCIYIFKDDYSKKAQLAVSLKQFTKCISDDNCNMTCVFYIHPRDTSRDVSLAISCTTNDIRKDWMRHVEAEITRTNHATSIYQHGTCEERVFEQQRSSRPHRNVDRPLSYAGWGSNGDLHYTMFDQGSPTVQYSDTDLGVEASKSIAKPLTMPRVKPTTILQTTPRRARTLPTFPGSERPKSMVVGSLNNAQEPRAPIGKTVFSEHRTRSSSYNDNTRTWRRESFVYCGSDRQHVQSIILGMEAGSYLVRKSRTADNEVLSVNIDGELKEFKIYVQDGTFTIDGVDCFSTLPMMIQHYRTHCLPKKNTRLTKAYTDEDRQR